MPDSTKYFQSWAGYDVPLKPAKEITLEQTRELEAWYEAEYVNGMLVRFDKYLHQEKEWSDRYEYWPETGKLKKRIMTKTNGEIVEQHFDRI
ncbi:MAG: hypothetical protein H6581_11765 [Bacteroidia bacterium]|nr:hypothetical protein [Bacteroidia bacterium]